MNSQVSASSSYERLREPVRRWIWDQGWSTLRDIQVQAIPAVLTGDDVIISAATASGKTEAAWLPIVSELSQDHGDGVQAIYLSPLKALINDQYARLRTLCASADITISRRHGDVVGAERAAAMADPSDVLLITPESLEAMFVLHGTKMRETFGALRYVVVDELHSFIGSERGAQLQSLMHRLDLVARRRIPRVALSATLADFGAAAEFLRPGRAHGVTVVESSDGEASELKLQVRGYQRARPTLPREVGRPMQATDHWAIAQHLFDTLRGHDNLVFANSRAGVEAYSDLFEQISAGHRVANEFLPHHGNLSKQFREDVEQRLRTPGTPTTAVCTSTLELGIDIGSADSVAQIGPPGSVSALRQRVGRTGRRDGMPAVLRVYVSEQAIDGTTGLLDRLRPSLVQTIAVVQLMLERWYEPPNRDGLHLSTEIQQVLSVIAQHGGAAASQLYSVLSGDGPFRGVSVGMFTQLLRDMAEAELLVQESDGTLHAGRIGEGLLNHYSFYAAFETFDEYRLITAGRTLGTIPVDAPILEDSLLIFAGKRWRVVTIDSPTKTIELVPARGGKPPAFVPSGVDVADGIRRRMQAVYESVDVPAYLDEAAAGLLAQGRTSYRQAGLDRARIIQDGQDCLLLPWRGSRVMNAMNVMLIAQGLSASLDGIAITCADASIDEVYACVLDAAEAPMDPLALAALVRVRQSAKYDRFLGEDLLNRSYAARDLDVTGAVAAFQAIADSV